MRYLAPYISQDLEKKMVFVGGPRQVGKTTLARALLEASPRGGRYFNWDYREDREGILKERWQQSDGLLVLDELHKYPRWRNWLKGVYDVRGVGHAFLVTGSARLEVYRKGGDSLMGRYHSWRLHPFSIDELPAGLSPAEGYRRLMTLGGFPEPFLENDEREARRWRRERFDRVLREDVRDLESVRQIQLLDLFVDALRRRVGSPVVLSHLAADLEISPRTAKVWLELLERMYLIFCVRPLTRNLPRAVLKPPKVYFFDPGDVLGDEGARLENLVAAGLLKRLHFLEDRDGHRWELRYIRDKEGREVDFALLKDGALEELVEVKRGEPEPSRHLAYYAERLSPARATQIVGELRRPFDRGRLRVLDPIAYFSAACPWKGTSQ